MSNKLLEKLQKNCRVKEADVMSESQFFQPKKLSPTPVPMINVALSGEIDGGIGSGLTMLAGPSKHFKCVDGNTPLEYYVKGRKYTTTYERFHLWYKESSPDVEVMTPFGETTPVIGTIKKKSATHRITISLPALHNLGEYDDACEELTVMLIVSVKHAFQGIDGRAILAKNIEYGTKIVTIYGNATVVSNLHHAEDADVYDIAIASPHWYLNQTWHGIVHHNTNFALLMAASHMHAYPDSILMFYDSEFGSPQAYFKSFGIAPERVLHVPIKTVEELKFDLVNQLEEIDKKDNVIVVIDSVGNLASKKELDDALDAKSVADMTRAKSIKSLFRMVTPYLNIKNIPLIAVNHTYEAQKMFSPQVVSGGTGIFYSSDTVWIVGRRQEKGSNNEIEGYHFVINVEKSRFVKEKSKIPITVTWKGGIERWSGLLDVALEGGYVKKPKNGWYYSNDPATDTQISSTNVRAKDTLKEEFWTPVFTQTDFADFIRDKYQIGTVAMIDETLNPTTK